MIAAGQKREEASKAIQNWMVDPTTLQSDEAVGKGALNAVNATVEPLVKDVELAQFAKDAAEKRIPMMDKSERDAAAKIAQQQLESGQQSVILKQMNVAKLPDEGLDLAPTGSVLRTKAVAERDAFKEKAIPARGNSLKKTFMVMRS